MGAPKKINVPHASMDWTKSDAILAKLYRVSRTRIGQIRQKLFGKKKKPMYAADLLNDPPLTESTTATDAASGTRNNESLPPNALTGEAMDIDKVVAASDSLFSGQAEFATNIKDGGERPLAPVNVEIATDNGQSERPVEIAASAPRNPAASALFRKVIVSSVKGIIGILKEVTRTMASAAGIQQEFTDKTLQKCEADQSEAVEQFQESLDMVLEKYNVQPKHAEEICLAIAGARLLAPYGLMIVEFRAEIARNRAKHYKLPSKE